MCVQKNNRLSLALLISVFSSLASATTYYVAPESTGGSDANDGSSEAMAFKTIQAAVDAASDGDEVCVLPGTYTYSDVVKSNAVVCIEKNIRVYSRDGRDVTTIDCGTKTDAEYMSLRVNAGLDGASFSGFTMTNSYTKTYCYYHIRLYSGTISNCVISARQTSRSTVVYLGGTAAMRDCIVDGTGTKEGNGDGNPQGLVCLYGSALIERCIIRNADVSNRFYPLEIRSKDATARNCLITGNRAGRSGRENGAAVYISAGTLEHCTIVGNSVYGKGGGVYVDGSSGIVCRNNIVYGNSADSGVGNNIYGSSGSDYGRKFFSNSCSPDLAGYEANGNISMDPLFVDAANGDYSLQSVSPAVNGASSEAWVANNIDLAYGKRLVGASPDMGAYECQNPFDGLLVYVSSSVEHPRIGDEITFVSTLVGSAANPEYVWNMGDGTTRAGSSVTHSYSAGGVYEVTCTVSGSNDSEASASFVQDVAPDICYVSPDGKSVAPYDTWENAATNLHTAYDYNPNSVIVTNGTYILDARGLMHDKDIVVKSVNGADKTILDTGLTTSTGNKTHRLLEMSHADAVLDGFSMIHGYAGAHNEPSSVIASAGTIRNCKIYDTLHRDRSRVIKLSGSAKMLNSVIDGSVENHGNTSNPQGILEMDGDSLVSGCIMTNFNYQVQEFNTNYPAAVVLMKGKSILRSSLIAENKITWNGKEGKNYFIFGGAVAMKGTGNVVENCTIVNNQTCGFGGGIAVYPEEKAAIIRNNIFRTNSADLDEGEIYLLPSATATIDNNLILSPVPDGAVNTIAKEPLFVKEAEKNYRLKRLSPAVNKGIELDWMDGASDLDGNPRIFDHAPDLGAYESMRKAPMILILK